jgi:hypothetical protein
MKNMNKDTGVIMKNVRVLIWILISMIIIISNFACSGAESNDKPAIYPQSENFGDYWYQGKAELNRYDLEQVRYGELRKGDAVLIFVTEDFLNNEQVKYEFGDDKSNVRSVLKLNFNRRYFTGIYPYSLLTSTFLPINSKGNHALKVTFTAQEWCGHTFMQLNNRDEKFDIHHRSYFQAEGDKQYELEYAFLEDESWTLIRINPELLPVGKSNVIPSMQYVRLFHKDYKHYQATITKAEVQDQALSPNPLIKYSIRYHDLPRSLSIIYEKEFPHQILGWEETYDMINKKSEGDVLITKAVRTNKLMLDYWSKNSVADSTYRQELGLQH